MHTKGGVEINRTLERDNLIYCPYTDRAISNCESNTEHIIPLSLGGTNELAIKVNKEFNSQLGSELDGELASDFFVALRRSEYDARGHSGKEPWATSKNAGYGDERCPAQVRLHRKHGLKIWDARDQELVDGYGTIQFNTFLDVHLPIRFAAKVALSAGYFVYGDHFRHHVDHHQVREIMRMEFGDFNREGIEDKVDESRFTALADDYLSESPSPKDWRLRSIRKFCNGISGSVVLLIPSKKHLLVSVGILGKYLALINVPAETETFPNEGDYEWGHVLAVVDKKLIRCSWIEGLRQLASGLNTTQP